MGDRACWSLIMPGGISGRIAVIKWHEYTAATIEGYSIARATDGVISVLATVVQQDRFKLTQRPLVFEAIHKKGAWRWPITYFTIADSGRLVARLGPEIPGNLCPDLLNPKSSVLT